MKLFAESDLLYRDKTEKARPVQELVPWLDYATPHVLLNKDGSVLAGFEYHALDPDNIDDDLVDRATAELERSIVANFDERVTLWWITKRSKDRAYLKQSFDNEIASKADEAYSKSFRSGKWYRMKHWLFVLYTGNTGVDKFMDRVSQLTREENMNPIAAFVKAATGSVSTNAGFGRDTRQLETNVRGLENCLAGFVGSTPSISYRRLDMNGMDNALFQILNPASDDMVIDRPIDAMLDSWLPANEIVAGDDVLRFTGSKDRYGAIYGIKQWAASSKPMMLEHILASDNELVLCQIVRCMGRSMSEKVLSDVRNFHKMTQYSLYDTVMSKLSKKKAAPDAGKHSLFKQAEEALARLTAGGPTSAYYNLSVMLLDWDHAKLEERCAALERLLSQKRLLGIREHQNLLPTFAAMLPGQWSKQSRYHLMNVANVADMAPIYTMNPGPAVHPHFSEVLGKPVPPLATFIDGYGCRFRFVPHVGQVGHAMLIAPTESGKTTVVNFMLLQFQKYGKENVNTFVFDRDGSCRITTELAGGKHIDYKSGRMRLNPFALDDGTQTGRTWIREFIIRMLLESGFTCSPEHREIIDETLLRMFDEDNRDKKTLTTFAATIPDKEIEQALGEWLSGRPYGLFDNEVDDFSLESWSTIEMKELQKIPRLMQMFMDYAFRRIDMKLDGNKLTFIYLEEASFLLKNKMFASVIDDWLKTFRKKNAFVWLTIQSPDSIDGDFKSSLVDNIKTIFLMYNKRVAMHRRYYKENFALTDGQVDMIARLRPRQDYMVVQDGFTRVFQTVFTQETLPYLRSEKHLQTVFEEHVSTKDTNPKWAEQYLAEAATFKRVEYHEDETETETA